MERSRHAFNFERRHRQVPTKWESNYILMAEILGKYGLTDKDIAACMKVSTSTFSKWKLNHPDFFASLEKGKREADMKVLDNFFLNCIDRFVEVEKVHIGKDGTETRYKVQEFIQGDKWAQARYLSLRLPQEWNETHRVQISNTNTNINIDFSKLSFEQLSMMESINLTQIPEDAGDSQ